MRDIAGDAIRATQIGARGWMKPESESVEALTEFQAVALEAERLSAQGMITIHQVHRESTSAQRCIDRISFTRLR
jgi:hypothetical protein